MRISQSKTQVKADTWNFNQPPNSCKREYLLKFWRHSVRFQIRNRRNSWDIGFFFSVWFLVCCAVCPPCLGAAFKYAHITHRHKPSVQPCSAHITEKTSLIAAKLWALVARVENIKISTKNCLIFYRESFIFDYFFSWRLVNSLLTLSYAWYLYVLWFFFTRTICNQPDIDTILSPVLMWFIVIDDKKTRTVPHFVSISTSLLIPLMYRHIYLLRKRVFARHKM